MTHSTDNEPAYAVLEVAGGKYSPEWWKDTADRVISTTAQAAIAFVTVGGVAPNLLQLDLSSGLAVAGTAGVLAFLKALAVTRA